MAIRAILSWAHDDERIPSNPAARVSQEVPKRVQTREKGYTGEEAVCVLEASLSYQPLVTGKGNHVRESVQVASAKRWVPLLCAFTGARVTEITQARKEDFRKEHGRWILRITPDAGSVKTSQYRDVPLHRQIEDLGFIRFLEGAGPGPLFHGAKDKAGYLQAVDATAAKAITDIFGTPVTENERGWLAELRAASDGTDPRLTARSRSALRGVFGK